MVEHTITYVLNDYHREDISWLEIILISTQIIIFTSIYIDLYFIENIVVFWPALGLFISPSKKRYFPFLFEVLSGIERSTSSYSTILVIILTTIIVTIQVILLIVLINFLNLL